ncbi:unnamed protein product [Cladocopium goreaui]|uniref:Phosphatidylinositol 4-phosphate 5-kinase 2 (AtPIP5K2) (1-phosphatidylinositol 4-phosphate kinase 2 ) (Diphosphoinositide kinase 2) (PtdIns(4)P-5-kinase 2) n=1 Tax=Cladocopium goreaui TaxID=2562237 RepID=A0A9P1FSN2_9DINO|nr:unnamed protein product [Cladocopium goreaui]
MGASIGCSECVTSRDDSNSVMTRCMDSPWTSNKSNVITAEDLNLAFGAMQQIQETQVHAIAPPALVCRSRTAASPKARPESKELEMENIAMLQLSNGALYEGHLEDFKAHGRGLLCYASGNRYDGDFVLDQAHGYGCFLWKDGSIYEGQWSRNLQVSPGSPSSTLPVPAGSIPGVTRVMTIHEGKVYATELPKDATYPHAMRVTFENFNLFCKAENKRSIALRALVPGDAIPGVSNTYARGESLVEIKVPKNAKPGDTLIINANRPQESQVHSLSLAKTAKAANLTVEPDEDIRRHDFMQQRLKENGGTWNPKIERASTDRLIVPGIVATEPISKGEVLVRCPPELFISSEAVRQMAPAYAILAAEAANELTFDRGNVDWALQATFLASMMAAAEDARIKGPSIPEAKREVWEAFLQVLLCETFTQHPYRLAAEDPAAFKSSLLPSCEADLIEYLAWTVLQWYDILTSHSSYAASSASLQFSAEQFLRAWLLVTTRAFDVDGTRTTLVPGLDSFNHDPSRASARAAADGRGGLYIVATRDIEAAEEVFLLYQQFSNSELYRKYGFTLPMEAMKHQSFTVLPSRVRFLLLKYLPVSHAGLLIEFHSAMLHPTLVAAIKACAANGKNYINFLRELLQFFAEAYERDPEMQDAMRSKTATEDLLRVKLSYSDGIGKEIWSDGSGFEGSFREGKKSGVGKVWWPEGCYEGDIDGGELEGQGTLTWKDGTSYCGGWVKSQKSGKGVMKWPDGRWHKGTYFKDKRHGRGCLAWPDGRQYCGEPELLRTAIRRCRHYLLSF